MKYSVITFGCRVNQADSVGFEEDLRRAGACEAPPESADLVVVNTCSVTASADQGARQTVRRIARANPAARIVVTGCYATRRPDEVRDLPNVLRVVSNADKPRFLALVAQDFNHVGSTHADVGTDAGNGADAGAPVVPTAVRFGDGEGSCGAPIEPGVAGRTAYTLRVQTGCSEPCSYCIIPATRGRPQSVPIETVVREARRVRAAGFKEIAITGVHLGSYGGDLAPAASLIELLRALERESDAALESSAAGVGPDARRYSDVRFRVSSLEPMDCTGEIVDLVACSDCVAPHFHLPLQHASNRMLAAMRRPYAIEQYADLVNGIRQRIPEAAIGSDVIVGFPGETAEDFDALVEYLEGSPLTHIHVFPYSDRPGTEASTFKEKVPGATVRERARAVRHISERLARTFRQSQVGSIRRALTLDDGTVAVTGNYLKIAVPPGHGRNEWIEVRVT